MDYMLNSTNFDFISSVASPILDVVSTAYDTGQGISLPRINDLFLKCDIQIINTLDRMRYFKAKEKQERKNVEMKINKEDLKKLPNGTRFSVTNGGWVGEIAENDEMGKYVFVESTRLSHLQDPPTRIPINNLSELDVKFCKHNEIRQALANISRDDTADKMADLLININWKTRKKMFEGLALEYLGADPNVRRGIDIAMRAMTGWTLPSIASQMLKEHGIVVDDKDNVKPDRE